MTVTSLTEQPGPSPDGTTMDGMGRHNTLINGRRGEDGAIAARPVIQPLDMSRLLSQPRGPVSDLPRPSHGSTPAVPLVPGHAERGIDGDKMRRGSMWVLASGVAAIAAVVSYSHIYDLGRAHGGSGVAARLLPLSVDMLIVVGELMLLHEADTKGRRFVLGWVLVWSGILATLAANVAFGAQYGAVGALIWGWPAYSFILAAGGMVAVVKRGAARDIGADMKPDSRQGAAADTATMPAADTAADMRPDKPADITPGKVQARARTAKRAVSGQDKAAAIIQRNPGLPNAEVAKRAGVSEKTVQRARAAAPRGQDPQTS